MHSYPQLMLEDSLPATHPGGAFTPYLTRPDYFLCQEPESPPYGTIPNWKSWCEKPDVSPAFFRRFAHRIWEGYDEGDPYALICLARMVEDRDPELAECWYRHLIELGHRQASLYLGRFIWVFKGGDPEAEIWLLEASVLGLTEADFLLGLWYETLGRQKILAQAYYRAAAEKGHEKAMLHLGLFLLSQQGNQDPEGESWLLFAHRAGNCRATGALLHVYRERNDIPKAMQMEEAFFQHPAKGDSDWTQTAQKIGVSGHPKGD